VANPSGPSPIFGVSAVTRGPGGPAYDVSCGQADCPPGQVQVQVPSATLASFNSVPGTACVPPPSCPPERFPQLNAGSLTWSCISGCDVIVQFGYTYGLARLCAESPPDGCDVPGEVPSFTYDGGTWQCEPECDGGLNDPRQLDGRTVCIPC
jgi:hypothetical protein